LTTRQALTIAIVFGLVAAMVVWWLERFEINRFHGEVQSYLTNQIAFKEWLKEKNDQ